MQEEAAVKGELKKATRLQTRYHESENAAMEGKFRKLPPNYKPPGKKVSSEGSNFQVPNEFSQADFRAGAKRFQVERYRSDRNAGGSEKRSGKITKIKKRVKRFGVNMDPYNNDAALGSLHNPMMMSSMAYPRSRGRDDPIIQCLKTGRSDWDPRIPDETGSALSTTITVFREISVIPSSSSSTSSTLYDYNAAICMLGDTKEPCWSSLTSSSSSTSSPGKTIHWANKVTTMGALFDENHWLSRPCGIVYTVSVDTVGLPHPVKVWFIPIAPINSTTITTSVPPGWPSEVNEAPSPLLCYWGARFAWMGAGKPSIKLPTWWVDKNGLVFEPAVEERGADAKSDATPWSGWLMYCDNLMNGDKIRVRCEATIHLKQAQTAATALTPFPLRTIPMDIMRYQRIMAQVAGLAQSGGMSYMGNSLLRPMMVGRMRAAFEQEMALKGQPINQSQNPLLYNHFKKPQQTKQEGQHIETLRDKILDEETKENKDIEFLDSATSSSSPLNSKGGADAGGKTTISQKVPPQSSSLMRSAIRQSQ